MRHLVSAKSGPILTGIAILACAAALIMSVPAELPGQHMTTGEMQLVSGAGCGSQNGTVIGCCTPCCISGFGFDSSAPNLVAATNCLVYISTFDCGCSADRTCLGTTNCTGG
jgi:hypothetical protein